MLNKYPLWKYLLVLFVLCLGLFYAAPNLYAPDPALQITGESSAQVIDVTTITPTGKVIFGTTIDLVNVESGATVTYRIVGEDEANVKLNLISVGSPIARALIGKEEGDIVVVKAPGGDIEYEIEAVEHL